MATLGVLEYLISVNDKGVKQGIERSERTIKQSADKTDREIKERSNKLSAWTIAKGQMIANFTERALRSAGNMTKQLLKSAISSYADYEQLVGGIETLFGKSTDKMMMYANRAYMTAGISANKYMELATSFAASLLQSCGEDTEIAADLAERAITDMADNANKFGSDLESIQNAYKGFSKQNYTMLDNLKLGYGGKKSEMERLIKEASALTDIQKELNIEVKANDMSYANIVKAISVIQKSRGVMGTTAEEASRTISGSIGMLKTSWQNMLTTMADPDGDLGTAMDKVSESAETVLHNLIPVFKQTLKSMTKLVKRALPEISKFIKTDVFPVVKDIAKQAINGIKGLFSNGGKGLLQLLMGDNYNDDSTWKDFGAEIAGKLKKGLQSAKLTLASILGLTDENGNPLTEDQVKNMSAIQMLVDGLTSALSDGGWLMNAITTLLDNAIEIVPKIADALTKLLSNEQFMASIQTLIGELINAITGMLTNPALWQAVWDTISTILFGGGTTGNTNPTQEGVSGVIDKALGNVKTQGKSSPKKLATEKVPDSVTVDGVNYTKNTAGNYVSAAGDTLKHYNPKGGNVLGFGLTLGAGAKVGGIAGAAAALMAYPLLTQAADFISYHGSDQEAIDNAAARARNKALYGKEELTVWDNLARSTQLLADAFKKEAPVSTGVVPDRSFRNMINWVVNGDDIPWKNVGIPEIEVPVKFVSTGFSFGAGTPMLDLGLGSFTSFLFGNRHEKGAWSIPYDDYPALLHRDEMVLTKSQARKYRDGEGSSDYGTMGAVVATAVEAAMNRVYVMMSGEKVGDLTTKRVRRNMNASSYTKLRALGG